MDKVISLYKDGVTPVAFPTGTGLSQIVIHDFTYTASRMGKASTITAKFEYGADLDGQWGDDIYATFNGEKYYLSGTPNSSYSNEDTRYTYEITLIAKRACFERIYFLDVVSAESDVTGYVSNSSKVNFYGDLAEFVARLNENIKKNGLDSEYGVRIDGTSVTADAYPKAFEPTVINFEDKYIFDAIADDCYNAYEVPFYWASETVSNATKMMLVFGEASGEVSTVFEYGIDKSLLSIQRNNASEEIITRCTGYGSSDNLPWYYPNETSTGHHTIDPHLSNSVAVNYVNYEIVSRYCNLLDENDVTLHIVQSDLPPGTSLEDIKVQSAKMVFQGATTNSGSGSGTISFSKSNFTSDGTDSPSFEITYEFYAPHDWEAMFSLGSDVLYGYGGKRATRNETVTSLKLEIGGTFTEILNSVSLIYYNQASGTWPSATTQVLGAGANSCKYSFKTPEDNQSHTVGYRYRMTVQYTMTSGIPSAYNYFNASFSMEMSGVVRGAYLYPNDETTKHVSLSECGIVFSDPTGLATDDWILIHNDPASYMEPQANLMPPIFRATQGERRFYEAKNYSFAKTISYIPDSYKYPDPFAEGNHAETTPPYKEGAPFDGEYVYGGYVHNRVFATNPEAEQASLSYYSFANLFVQGKQREHIQEFPDIKPTIAGTTNAQNQRIDQILDVAFDNNDTDDYTIEDEQKNYTHDYFYIKLRKFSGDSGFNLFDHAIDSGAMTINMTSGLCGGCKFEIMVDENTKKNPVKVDANGNLLRDSDGNVDIWKNSNDYQASQNDTSTNEVWIAVKKDIDTFGVIMPNRGKSYIPSAGDTFVITGIDLPSSYIYEAEKRLEAAIIKYMYENNDEKFSFSIGFSRIFFAHNNAVLQQMRESAKIQIRYPLGAAEPISTYITTFTYKMEDGSPLPQISVELADKITLPRTMVRRLTKTIVKTLNINGSSSSDVAAAASAARRAAAQQQSSSSSFNDADYVHQGEVGAITKQMLGDDTVEYIDAIGTRVTTIEDWFAAPSLDALTVGALTSTSIAVDGIGIAKDSSSNLLLGGNTKVSGDLTVTGNSSLGTVTSGTWQGTAIGYDYITPLFIGTTRVQSTSAAQAVTGITQYQFEGQSGSEIGFEVVTVSVNGSNVRAIHTTLPFYSDSWIASGGVGSGGGGGGGGGGGSISLVISGSENGSVLTNLSINSAGDTLTATKGDIGLNSLSNVTLSSPSSGQILSYNGTAWVNSAAPATGVTSVGLTMPTGFSVASSPITSSGTIAVTFASGYSLPSTESQTSWTNAVTTANNAASAITAINARTIWGQTFSGNVSGNMTGVGTINGYSLGGTIANNNNGFVTGDAVYDYAAKAILFGGTTYTQSGGLITITTANIISAIGTAPVARATADASGNTITTTYATKSELASVESDVLSANNAIAENRARIEDIEAWKVAPTANTAYVKSLGVNTINLDGIDVWRESDVVNVGGNIKAKISTSSDVSVKAENSSGQIGLVASNGIRGLYNVTGTSGYVIATNGTNTKLLLGNVSIGTDFQNGHKLYVSGNSYFQGNITTSGAATINNALTAIGATSLQSTLSVSSNATLQSDLSVGGTTTLSGNFYVKNGNTTKFSVAYSTGNTSISGTLGVSGAATFGSTITLNNSTASNRKIIFGSSSKGYIVWDSANEAIHVVGNLYADGWVASGGIGAGGGGGGGATTLNGLDDVTITSAASGQILTHDGSNWVNKTLKIKVGSTAYSSTYTSGYPTVTIAYTVPETAPTLAWNTTTTIATLAGKDIKVKLPESPSYTLSAATSGALGGIKIGYGESSANRAVKLNNSSQAYITLTGSGIAEVLGTTAVTNATNATNAVTATNLANKPSLDASGNQITVTAGGKTSSAFTVPFATVASKLGTTQVGSSTTPIYIDSNGLPQTIQYTLGAACEKGIATSVNSTNTNLVTSQAVYNYLIDFATNAELGVTNNAVSENRTRIIDLEDWKAYPTANTAYVKRLGVGAINLDGVDIWREAEVAVVGGGIAAQKTTTSDTFVKARNSNGEIGLLTSSNRGVYDFSRTEVVNGVTQSSPKWLITTNGTNTRLSCGNVAIGDSFNNNYKFYVNGTTYLNGATTISDTLTFNGSNRKIVFNSGTNECYLVYDSSNNAVHIKGNLYADGWVASGGIGTSGGGGGASTLNDLDDVQIIGTPVGGQILKYNGTSHQWENSTETLGGLQSVSASTTVSNPSYIITSIGKSGTAVTSTKANIYYNKVSLNGSATSVVTASDTAVSFYAPTTAGTTGQVLLSNGSETTKTPTWGYVTHVDLGALDGTGSSANRMMKREGFEVLRVGAWTDAPTKNGTMLQFSRYAGNTDTGVNTAAQLYVPHQQNKLYFRNSWATGHNPTGDEWKAWLEVATIAADGTGSLASNLIHTYTIQRSLASGNGSWATNYTDYQSPAAFSTKNLVAVIYDSSDNQVMADISLVASSSKYCVKVSFAESIGSSDAYRLVVYGL